MVAVRGILLDARFRQALSTPFEWRSGAFSFRIAFQWKCGRIPGPCPWCARAEGSLAFPAFERARVLLARNWPAQNFLRWGRSARRVSAIRRQAKDASALLR